MNLLKALFRPKKTPDHALQELIYGLKSALAENLRSVVVFGSFASGEFLEGTSNMNVMVLADALDAQALNRMAAPVRAWVAGGHAPPILVQPSELPAMAGVLPIEFLDIIDHHRVVFGDAPFTRLTPDPARLRLQIEHDLTILLLRLRRAAAQAGAGDAVSRLLAQSLPSAWTLCRALLRVKGLKEPVTKIEAARRISADAGLDLALVDRLDLFRVSRSASEGAALFPAYLELVEKLLHYAGRSASSY